jgi:hypothetical protein
MALISINRSVTICAAIIVSSVFMFLAGVTCATARANKVAPCTLESLPKELQGRLKTEFASWRIQDLGDLSVTAKERWEGERRTPGRTEPLCPGFATGYFKTDQLSYAVLLVPNEKPDAAYRIVIFTPSGGTTPGSLDIADQWDKGGAANYFIRGVRIAKVFSAEWLKKLKVAARDGVESVDAAENEYGVDVYFWADGQYRHEPIDD